MDDEHKRWIMKSRSTLVDSNVPIEQLLDDLISEGVFNVAHDDYQKITTRDTLNDQIRTLLDGLLSKSNEALACFKKALQARCPHVLAKCDDMPNDFAKVDAGLRSYYESIEELRPFSWIKKESPCIKMSQTCRLAMIDKTEAEAMLLDEMASSVKEDERHTSHLRSQPKQEQVIHLEDIFEEPQSKGHVTDKNLPDLTKSSTLADTMTTAESSGCFSAPSSRQRVSIYGGAGCGKTASVLRAANLYARKQLWRTRFRLFLFWRLRDIGVQNAETFTDLLATLPGKRDRRAWKNLALAIQDCEGEGVLIALDGVDELRAPPTAFVRSLLSGSALKKACILATSRPCTEAWEYFEEYDKHLELLGFDEEQVETFIEQQLGDKPEALAKLRKTLEHNAAMGSLMVVPLLAFMVCQVFSLSSDSLPATRTQLYSKLLTLIIKRTAIGKESNRVDVAGETSHLKGAKDVQKISGKARKLLLEIAKVASLAHNKGRAIFDQELVDESKCSPDALQLGLIHYHGDDEEDDNQQGQYSFEHLTVQEFLVAFLLADQIMSATPENSEKTLREKMNGLGMGPHQFAVVQFLSGLLPGDLKEAFFSHLNDWFHGYQWREKESEACLRSCLQCVKEAEVAMGAFPKGLILPKKVRLCRTNAVDMLLVASAIKMCPASQSVEKFSLSFDEVSAAELPKSMRAAFSKKQTQAREALEELMKVLPGWKSLRYFWVDGPKYKLFTEDAWESLMRKVRDDSLEVLCVEACQVEDGEVEILARELPHTQRLKTLYLHRNRIGDHGVRLLADVLEKNQGVRELQLLNNCYGEESVVYVKKHLSHLRPGYDILWVGVDTTQTNS